ncbi:MAG: inorganic phosphate transporter, partial [Granulosicoccus sp.]|nr:inorganic phosphate transporter [Granulosicoccus sp.]
MEIEKIAEIEHATWAGRQELFRLGTALLFIVGVMIFVGSLTGGVSNMLVVAAMIGGYMALNIGAN